MLQTADVDAKLAAEDAETGCLLACGSLSCFAAAAATALAADAAMAAADVATATTAGSLSCCFCYAETMAVDVAADNHFLLAGGAFPLPLYILQDYNFVLIIQAA